MITGLSGSGKSSLAFDTIYAEGQRRYVESLSAYARQFLSQMQKPRVELIEGLSPAIAIEQRTAARNPRSTVGTATEIYDYMRLLYARVGHAHCHLCGREISQLTVDQMADRVLSLPTGKRVHVVAPVVRGKKGQHRDVLARIERGGFVRVCVDGETMEVHDVGKLAKSKKHDIDVIVDRLVLKDGVRQRLVDSLETALELTAGLVRITTGKDEMLLSATASCPHCGVGPGEIEPRMFSFNSPYGACQTCGGLGTQMRVEIDLIVPDPRLSLRDGAVSCWPDLATGWARHKLDALSEYYGFGLMTPFEELDEHVRNVLLRGSGEEKIEYKIEFEKGRWEYVGGFEGAIPNLERRYRETKSENVRRWIEGFMAVDLCPDCEGARLRPESLAVTVGELPSLRGWPRRDRASHVLLQQPIRSVSDVRRSRNADESRARPRRTQPRPHVEGRGRDVLARSGDRLGEAQAGRAFGVLRLRSHDAVRRAGRAHPERASQGVRRGEDRVQDRVREGALGVRRWLRGRDT